MEINYELYVKQNDRWILEAHFQSHQREEAVDDAKQMAKQGHIQAVKVVREQRNPGTGVNRESTIYSSEIKKGQKTGRKDPGDDDDYGGFDDGDDDDDYGGGGGDGDGGWDDFEVDVEERSWGDFEAGDDDDDRQSTGGGARGAARTVQNVVSGPEAVVLTKILVIVGASLAFAAIVTWMVQRGGF
ncbi:MAG: hypothetical protein O3C65_01020 [Proteobacteria bacterium]|nr:hypothetical protein [Pseudomonadota bacterium]MDA1057239.1 hypothetical protein [Pseudomonadota bacterium]